MEELNKNTELNDTDKKLDVSDIWRKRTKNSCIKCGEEFETWLKIDSGDYDEIFCSEKCGTEYYGSVYVEPEFD